MPTFSRVAPQELPMPLLLLADPSEHHIATYLEGALCYLASEQGQPVGACVLNVNRDGVLELFNIAVAIEAQAQGIGSALLEHVIADARAQGYARIELGTGTFGHQLAFYQRAGFRVESVIRDHFLDHYDEPIHERGIQHKDMLRLALTL
ncbi:GNAT family N-acetyltransferase [Halomonas elongata]|uniref:GNAT family N-acetyltransferase n=1 Tax=Halomonas elongata (strain ATCC 33173 / DSM 2581 / NBRC 15536 / NCIMB 2198 / 1H9) TaxID=768066 RepID=E1V513_HALED|nr:GNAT family N-acetyltransferase [Halomonas elongata]WBF18299.1 GNAT family N-acetyltransferase [Halomonas elongata]WPU47151.1 GNAT family N-acetyltransferase [Halomonas elongata DSM 2581]CBV41062.1 GNAT family acetyltransferase [Halomonas elongata DSM 2581]